MSLQIYTVYHDGNLSLTNVESKSSFIVLTTPTQSIYPGRNFLIAQSYKNADKTLLINIQERSNLY